MNNNNLTKKPVTSVKSKITPNIQKTDRTKRLLTNSFSNYQPVPVSEVTAGALQIWRTLPEKIRQDPSLASFRQEHERLGLGGN